MNSFRTCHSLVKGQQADMLHPMTRAIVNVHEAILPAFRKTGR